MRAPALYYLDFVLYPALALGAALVTCRSLWWCAGVFLGFVLFTLAEYWVHRSVLHRYFYHGTHERHHKRPREFVVFHWSLIPSGFAVLFLLLPAWLVAGFALGWFWFCVCHHAMHHWNGDFVYRWSRWHDLHHRFIRCNFGITHPFWDVVFDTYRSPSWDPLSLIIAGLPAVIAVAQDVSAVIGAAQGVGSAYETIKASFPKVATFIEALGSQLQKLPGASDAEHLEGIAQSLFGSHVWTQAQQQAWWDRAAGMNDV